MTAADDIALGRRAYDEQDWAEACAGLQGAVDAEDLERLGIAEVLVGRDEEALETLQRAHSAYLARGEVERAAWCGAQLAMGYMLRGDHARSSGWIARSRRLLDDGRRDCVELGHLMVPSAVQAFVQGDLERAS